MIFCSKISVSFDFFVPPLPVYIQRNTGLIVLIGLSWEFFFNCVYLIFCSWKTLNILNIINLPKLTFSKLR
ncbi:hypothetical protein BpHYR1_050492 [Brachionus plicatilis]|uniref:Uncharacterized protein n=1 Tax=Brachionus plicatilis TaxID=10195 RepID=A0A3M7T2F6_BRAPC|nr:hypothetical protein BpHYR1_050492 [Brachionus plicatilis]